MMPRALRLAACALSLCAFLDLPAIAAACAPRSCCSRACDAPSQPSCCERAEGARDAARPAPAAAAALPAGPALCLPLSSDAVVWEPDAPVGLLIASGRFDRGPPAA